MKIRDYDLLNNFCMLFEYPIFTFHINTDLKRILDEAGIEYKGIEENSDDCMKNCNLILGKEIEEIDVEKGYIFTDVGVRYAITKNIRSNFFSEEFRKRYIQNTEKKLYYKYFKFVIQLISDTTHIFPDVMVYSIGKTGSTTICASLDSVGLNWIKPHNLYKIEEAVGNKIASDWFFCLEKLKKGVKIISIVRDPIARDISAFMQNLDSHLIRNNKKVQEQLIEFMDITSKQNCLYKEWFDHEMFAIMGINVFDYPFDRDKGFGIIKKDNIEVLLLTLEKLNQNENIIGEFIGESNFKLIPSKIGDEKRSQYIYKELKKNIQIPYEVIERNYKNNLRLEHFYSQSDINCFRQKWENNVEKKENRIISDHELIKNPKILAECAIVIYGCGQNGRDLEMLLADNELDGNIEMFCETNCKKRRIMGYQVVDVNELKRISESKEFTVIISSDIYHYEIKKELVSRKVKAKYVFTNWAIRKVLR